MMHPYRKPEDTPEDKGSGFVKLVVLALGTIALFAFCMWTGIGYGTEDEWDWSCKPTVIDDNP